MTDTATIRSAAVMVQVVESGLVQQQIPLESGGTVRFSDCRDGGCGAELRTKGLRGMIETGSEIWTFTNHSRTRPVALRNAETPHEQFHVPAMTGPVPVPFEISAVCGSAGHELTVLGPEPAARCEDASACCERERADWFPARQSKAGRVLHALETIALSRGVDRVPSGSELAEQVGISERAVRGHIDYLIGRFGIVRPAGPRGASWKHRALVLHVLARGVPDPDC